MKKNFVLFAVVFFVSLFIFSANGKMDKVQEMQEVKELKASAALKPDLDFGKIPLYFITNKGQVDAKARFYAKASRYTLWLTKEGMVFDSTKTQSTERPRRGAYKRAHSKELETALNDTHPTKMERDVSRLFFLDANKNPEMVAMDTAQLKVNYFKGNDKSKWHGAVPTSMAVLYRELYKNIDLKVYGIEKQIEYDWVVKPGGDPDQIRVEYKNVKGTRIDEEGNLLIETDFGELMHKRPFSYQQQGSEKIEVKSGFKKIAENIYGFEVGAYDKNRELIIDPVVLAYSTYLGGSDSDIGWDIAVDSSGCVYVTGYTESTNFPTLNQYQTFQGATDVFVTKFASNGSSLLYSTYLGGSGEDQGYAIAVDAGGNAYVTGYTRSTNFPTLNQYQAFQGDRDAFVTKLDTTQSGISSLLYSTYLGGTDGESSFGIAVDGSGYAYVVGETTSTNFPTFNQFQADQGGADGFVAKLDPSQSGAASLLYSTYLGGGSTDRSGRGIAVDDSGNVYVTGWTASTDFPVLNQYQTYYASTDAIVTKLDTTQSGTACLLYSTYLGGDGGDLSYAVAVDDSGYVYVTGRTSSTNFPTLNQYQAFQGDRDAFVTKLDPSQSGTSSLLYSTYLGGTDTEHVQTFAVDGSGNAYVSGFTDSTDFPTRDQFQTDQGNMDACVFKLDTTQMGDSSLIYSTYLGGGGDDKGYGIAIDGSGDAYVIGFTNSTDFPTINPYQDTYGGGSFDAFVAKLSFGPTTSVPGVTTATVTDVDFTTASGGGDVINDGGSTITARGVCWSTSPAPTTADNHTTDGTGTGTFTSSLTGLTPDTTYYVRAYAVNTTGTGYGNEVTFTTTTAVLPTVTTAAIGNIDTTTASCGGNVTDGGGAAVTARGVCWSTAPNPTIADYLTSDGTGTGEFTSALTGLTPETTYYVRAYAVNSAGTAYGSETSFTTIAPNQEPVADAGDAQTVHPGDTVILDGSGSYDPDENYPLTYAWNIQQKPAGSQAALSTPDQTSTSITIDAMGDYTIQLVVTDSLALAGQPDTVLISTTNSPPAAAAGDDQSVTLVGTTVYLDGSQSWDPDGDNLDYAWTFIQTPAGSQAALSDPTAVNPTFVPDVYGEYIIQLTVNDPWISSDPDALLVSFENIAPVADAGDNHSCTVGETVTFDGSGSFDPNGDTFTYSWEIASAPVGSTAQLTNADSVSPSLQPDEPGEYVVSLVVNDGLLDSLPASATVVAISYQDAVTQTLENLIAAINNLPSTAFKNKNMKKTLTRKVSVVLKNVDEGDYAAAYDKLQNDVLGKTNGCAESGSPDKNDWVKSCAEQAEVYPLIIEALNLLSNLL